MRTSGSFPILLTASLAAILAGALASCSSPNKVEAHTEAVTPAAGVTVGVVSLKSASLGRNLTLSSELVPYQEIDVYAKESGYVKDLLVDYGTHVKAGQLLATLEIPELQIQLQQDDAAIKSASDQVTHAEHELSRMQATANVLHLQYDRLDKVSKGQPGLVAQQEVDDSQGKDLAAEAQVESARSNLALSQSLRDAAVAKRQHDQVLFDYSKITAPFAGVVTQRFANLGALVQAGTGSSTQAMPLVRLSQDDRFRLVIPVPESYVSFIHVGDPVSVFIPSLKRTLPGKVARFSVDVREDTRTMHTEVDVMNPGGLLVPGLYAEATITLEQKPNALALPLQALNQENGNNTVYVVDPSGKIEIRPVVLGIQTDTQAEVLSGLREGDQVVVSDRSSLKAGEQVHPQTIGLMQFQSQEEQK
jgi:RND family efflux transporter MFP subunit